MRSSSSSFGSQSSNSSNSSQQYDYTSGQNAANQMGQQILAAKNMRDQAMLRDPMSVAASIMNIRRMQDYMNAYKNGHNLQDQEVIRDGRLAGVSNSQSRNSSANSSFSSSYGR